METFVTIVESVKPIAEAIIELMSIIGVVLTVYIYCSTKKSDGLKSMARQIIAYHAEEAEAIKWICELKQTDKTRSVQIELKNRAEKSKENLTKERPTMTASNASNYL